MANIFAFVPGAVRSAAGARMRLARTAWIGAALLAWLLSCGAVAAAVSDDLVGLRRDELVQYFGKPESMLRSGDTEFMSFASGMRVELRNDEIIAVHGPAQAVVIADDGTRYIAGEDGKLQSMNAEPRVTFVPKSAPPPDVISAASEVDLSAAALVAPPESDAPIDAAPAVVAPAEAAGLVQAIERASSDAAPAAPSRRARVAVQSVGAIVRLVLAAVILRIALGWLGLPCYWPDLFKVSVFYVFVRESVHAIGALGGNWELLHFFKVDDVLGFFALAICLHAFHVTRAGLTTLKVAAMTKSVTYVLMMLLGLALTFGLHAIA